MKRLQSQIAAEKSGKTRRASETSSSTEVIPLKELVKAVQDVKRRLHTLMKKPVKKIDRKKLRNMIILLGETHAEYEGVAPAGHTRDKLREQYRYAINKAMNFIRDRSRRNGNWRTLGRS